METIFRALAVYLGFLLVFRLSGKRTLAQATPFDLVLLLIISEAAQNAIVGSDDYSLTTMFLAVLTLVGTDMGLSYLKQRNPALERIVDDVPVLLMADGRTIDNHLQRNRVDLDDILEAARSSQGLERFDQIKFAVLERDGTISIIPRA